MDKFIGQALAPFFLVLCLLIAWPIKTLIRRHMPNGWLKRLLLTRVGGASRGPSGPRQ